MRPGFLMSTMAVLTLGAAAQCHSGEGPARKLPFPVKRLPAGWRVEKQFTVPPAQAAAIGRKLGGKVDALTNTILNTGGRKLRVNVISCNSAAEAAKVQGALMKMKGHRWLCLLRGKTVVEFVCRDIRTARHAHYALGYSPAEVTYGVSFRMATISKADYPAGNRLFNAMLQLDRPGQAPAARRSIATLRKGFVFGSDLKLRTCASGARPPVFAFTPKPKSRGPTAGGELTAFSFEGLRVREGLPYVSVRATVTSRAFGVTPTGRKAGPDLLAANRYWPAKDPKLVKLAGEITAGARSVKQKAQLILEWLRPGRNVKYGGPQGSRKGVAETLKQRQGRCWDFSDCFVTLGRASGVPCRQVAGWLHGQCGHVWAEFLVEGKGWVQVDPTAGMGCGSDYIPYLTTEDGEMPIVYVSMPKIRIVKKSGDADASSTPP